MELIKSERGIEVRQIGERFYVVQRDDKANQVRAPGDAPGLMLCAGPVWSESATRYVARGVSRSTAMRRFRVAVDQRREYDEIMDRR